MPKLFITYYKMECGSFRIIKSDKPDEFDTYERLPKSIERKFHVFKGYEASDEGLRLFTDDFIKWCKELADNSVFAIFYTYYFSHHISVENVFKKFSKGKYEHIEEVNEMEGEYMERCHNGGLLYCQEGYSGPCFGYDFNSFYPRILGDKKFQIATKKGTECFINLHQLLKTKTKLQYGMYDINITSTNPEAIKVFSFSKHDTYTHYSIEFAYKHRKEFGFKFQYYISDEDECNACVYEDDDLITSDLIFKRWLSTLTRLRTAFPKNKLLKHLLSSLYGHLCRSKTLMRTYEDILEQKLDVGYNNDSHYKIEEHIISDNNDYYILKNTKERYHHGLARMKPFLVAFARNRIADVAMRDISNVVRIHTDNVTYTEEQDMRDIRYIFPEDKTTGNLQWKKINQQPIRL